MKSLAAAPSARVSDPQRTSCGWCCESNDDDTHLAIKVQCLLALSRVGECFGGQRSSHFDAADADSGRRHASVQLERLRPSDPRVSDCASPRYRRAELQDLLIHKGRHAVVLHHSLKPLQLSCPAVFDRRRHGVSCGLDGLAGAQPTLAPASVE
eukprot:3939965-Rhodomonas_salina.1